MMSLRGRPLQVEASLPLRLRNSGDTRGSPEDYSGLEAISGSFGEGIDDGLKVSTRRVSKKGSRGHEQLRMCPLLYLSLPNSASENILQY